MSQTSNLNVRGSSTRPPSLVPPAPPGSSPAGGSGTIFCRTCGTGFAGDGRLIAISEHLDTHDLRGES
jgi:hypothetical protein